MRGLAGQSIHLVCVYLQDREVVPTEPGVQLYRFKVRSVSLRKQMTAIRWYCPRAAKAVINASRVALEGRRRPGPSRGKD